MPFLGLFRTRCVGRLCIPLDEQNALGSTRQGCLNNRMSAEHPPCLDVSSNEHFQVFGKLMRLLASGSSLSHLISSLPCVSFTRIGLWSLPWLKRAATDMRIFSRGEFCTPPGLCICRFHVEKSICATVTRMTVCLLRWSSDHLCCPNIWDVSIHNWHDSCGIMCHYTTPRPLHCGCTCEDIQGSPSHFPTGTTHSEAHATDLYLIRQKSIALIFDERFHTGSIGSRFLQGGTSTKTLET